MKLLLILLLSIVGSSLQQDETTTTTTHAPFDLEAAIIQLEKDMLALNSDINSLADDGEAIKAKLYKVESDVSYAEIQENEINQSVNRIGEIFNTVDKQFKEIQEEYEETEKTLKKVQSTVRDFINQKIDLEIDDAHLQQISQLGYSLDDTNFLITASTDGSVKFWQDGQFGGILPGITGPVTGFAITANNLLVTGTDLSRSVLVYTDNYQLLKELPDLVDGFLTVIADPDNANRVYVGANKKVSIVDLNLGEGETPLVVSTSGELTGPVNGLALDLDDGELFTTCLFDDDIYVWNRTDGTFKQKLTGHTRPVEALVLDRRDRLLVSSSQDGSIRVWDPLTLQLVREYTEHTDSTTALAVDQGILYSASRDKTIKIWVLESPSTASVITYQFTGRGHPTSLAINFKQQLVVGSSFGDVQYLSIKKLTIDY